jgi:Amidase
VGVEVPDLELCRVAHTVTVVVESSQAFDQSLKPATKLLTPEIGITLATGRMFKAADYLKARLMFEVQACLRTSDVCRGFDAHRSVAPFSLPSACRLCMQAQCIRRQVADNMDKVFAAGDVLITPTTPITAPRKYRSSDAAGESNLAAVSALMKYSQLGNLLGLPAATVPVGRDSSGLPIGCVPSPKPWLPIGTACRASQLFGSTAWCAHGCTPYMCSIYAATVSTLVQAASYGANVARGVGAGDRACVGGVGAMPEA